MSRPAQPKWMTLAGWVLTLLATAMLIMSGAMKFSNDPKLLEGLEKMRMTKETMQTIGVVELACAAIFLIPQTTVLGAILITGYLGGAVFVHVQGGDPISNIVTPVVIGVVAWLGVYLREPRLRAIAPIRTKGHHQPPLM
ncbi:MAG TPA: DoxX family protein [Caulifigura sp.]|nr:DoxX family protein [Caulifigura sp.]